jgi:MFS family permease
MITFCYLGSAAVLAVTALFVVSGSLGTWSFMALILLTFFIASAGASSAYLTVSEIFPMETRALAIAFFYAIGTAAGGITGPLLFGHLIGSGDASQLAIGFWIAAGVMTLGGIAELFLGVRAEGASLEQIAKPLTAQEAEDEGAGEGEGAPAAPAPPRAPAPRPRPRPRARARERYRPGPGRAGYSPLPLHSMAPDAAVDREVEVIARVLVEHGVTERRELARLVGARFWGPGRFATALQAALRDGRAHRVSRHAFGPPPGLR